MRAYFLLILATYEVLKSKRNTAEENKYLEEQEIQMDGPRVGPNDGDSIAFLPRPKA